MITCSVISSSHSLRRDVHYMTHNTAGWSSRRWLSPRLRRTLIDLWDANAPMTEGQSFFPVHAEASIEYQAHSAWVSVPGGWILETREETDPGPYFEATYTIYDCLSGMLQTPDQADDHLLRSYNGTDVWVSISMGIGLWTGKIRPGITMRDLKRMMKGRQAHKCVDRVTE